MATETQEPRKLDPRPLKSQTSALTLLQFLLTLVLLAIVLGVIAFIFPNWAHDTLTKPERDHSIGQFIFVLLLRVVGCGILGFAVIYLFLLLKWLWTTI